MNKLLFVLALGAFLIVPPANAGLIENHSGMTAGADRLLELQFENGAFPWMVGASGEFQNVQGITAVGLLKAFELSGDLAYLGNETSGVQANRDWLVNVMDTQPSVFMSSSNAFFLADYARLSGNLGDYEEAQRAMDSAIARWGGAQELSDYVLNARVSPYGNMGVWDVALFIRAAQEVGYNTFADELTVALLENDIVDIFDNSSNFYELGLSGLLFGLAESGFVEYQDSIAQAQNALLATQCEDGSFPTTWQGTVFCSEQQSTAYAVIGLAANLELLASQTACDFLVATQGENGGWDLGGYEIAENNAEAVMALAACIAPINNGVTSYTDVLRSIV